MATDARTGVLLSTTIPPSQLYGVQAMAYSSQKKVLYVATSAQVSKASLVAGQGILSSVWSWQPNGTKEVCRQTARETSTCSSPAPSKS
ncbi:hypothetical protein EON64_04150 [archaeon]|nr:MAG: hypothetical protein EON64_04150 [archaeon]